MRPVLSLMVALALAANQTSHKNSASGGVCERGSECLESEYCSFFFVCQPRKNEGEYCTGDQPGDQLCVQNLICDQRDHMCVRSAPKCRDDSSCRSGEYCDVKGTKTCFPVKCNSDSQCSSRYFCRTGTCTERGQQGATCSQSLPCAEGLNCQSGACQLSPTPAVAPATSIRTRATGAPCTRELDCAIGSYCQNGDPRNKDSGVCAPWSQEGSMCNETTLCDQGLFCVVQVNYGDSGLCIPFQEKGYAKLRPGSTRWIQAGRPLTRTPPEFGMQDAGSIPVFAEGPRNYATLAPSQPPRVPVPERNIPATPPPPTPSLYGAFIPANTPASSFISPVPIVLNSRQPETGANSDCCEALTATCLSCKLGTTPSAFCARNPTVSGCAPVPGLTMAANPIPANPVPIILNAGGMPSVLGTAPVSTLPSLTSAPLPALPLSAFPAVPVSTGLPRSSVPLYPVTPVPLVLPQAQLLQQRMLPLYPQPLQTQPLLQVQPLIQAQPLLQVQPLQAQPLLPLYPQPLAVQSFQTVPALQPAFPAWSG